jgi:hypothetical protein
MSARIGIGVDIWANRGDALSPEALAWQTNIIANGGTITPSQLTFFDTWFFKPAKAAGNILTELDRLNIYCALVGSEMAARTCMIRTVKKVDPINSPTFDNNGYKSVGTGYLNLNYNTSVDAVKFANANNNFGTLVKIIDYASGNKSTIGANTGPNNIHIDRNTAGVITFFNRSNVSATDVTAPTGNVFLATKKTSTTAGTIIVNATETAAVFTNFPTVNLSQFELTRNNSGSPIANFDQFYHYCSFHGSANFNWSGFRTIMNNLIAAAGL